MLRRLGLLAVTPLLAFPLMTGTLLAADAVAGERLLSFYVRYEQRLLWDTFWADFASALPMMYALVGSTIALLFFIGRARGGLSRWSILTAFAALGWGAAFFITGHLLGMTQLALAAAGILTSLPPVFVLPHLATPEHDGGNA